MSMSLQIITILLCVLGTVLTRALPFLIFSSRKPVPPVIHYLGKALPAATFGMLVVYCLRDVSFISGNHGIPELISIIAVILLHLLKRNMLLSIAGGTVCYMLLVQTLFC